MAGAVLPMSYAYTMYGKLQRKLRGDRQIATEEEHAASVERVCKDVQAWQNSADKSKGLLRTKRDGNASHSVRTANKDGATKIEVGDLDRIIKLDTEKGTILVEPGVTVGKCTEFLTAQNLQLDATLEMEEATLVSLLALRRRIWSLNSGD